MRYFFSQIFENSPLHSVRSYQEIFNAHFSLAIIIAIHLFILHLNPKSKSISMISILQFMTHLRNRKFSVNSYLITRDCSSLYLIYSIQIPLNQEAFFDSKDFYKMFTYSQTLSDI